MGTRAELVAFLEEIAALLRVDEQGSGFRSRAFIKAAAAVQGKVNLEHLPLSKLKKVEGIGKSTAEAIHQYYREGKIDRLEELRSKFPADFVALLSVPGLGAKTALRLRDELGIGSVSDLRTALTKQKLRTLSGLGAAFEDKLKVALDHIGNKENRRPLHVVLPIAEGMKQELLALSEVSRVELGGSLRRFRETISDIDILVIASDEASVIDYFINTPRIDEVIVRGRSMCSVYLDNGLQVDLRVAPKEEFGAALLHFSSGRHHNIKLRMRAHDLGFSLNENSLHPRGGTEAIVSETEEGIYQALGMDWIEPELRQDKGEIAAAIQGRLPAILHEGDLRGDLHVHSSFSRDGHSSVAALAHEAVRLGYEYLAISDHGAAHENGLTAKEQLALATALNEVRAEVPQVMLLHSCELNIAKDGTLDYSDEEREIFNFCVASVHSEFALSRSEQTERLIYAMEEPCVRILGHMTGRRIGTQAGIDIDVEAVLEAARENDVAIEVNSQLDRLDPPSEIIRRGVEVGNLFVISSDAHSAKGMQAISQGLRYSRRGWLPGNQVINTWPCERFVDWLQEPFG